MIATGLSKLEVDGKTGYFEPDSATLTRRALDVSTYPESVLRARDMSPFRVVNFDPARILTRCRNHHRMLGCLFLKWLDALHAINVNRLSTPCTICDYITSDRKERMKIIGRQESRCGIRPTGSRMAHLIDHIAIAENTTASGKALRAVQVPLKSAWAVGGKPAESCNREWRPAEAGTPSRPEGGVENAKGGRFRRFCCRKCKFVRLCPRLPALSAFARLFVGGRFLSGQQESGRMRAA